MAINKVVYGNNTLLDLTEDTVTEEDVMEGKTFHDKSGLKRTGSATQGGRVQDVEVNGESVVNAQGVAEVVVPVIDDENITNESVYSSEKIEDRLDEYVDKDVAEVKSATDEFSTINGGLLSSLKVALSPIQDLHGYDHPWVGGAEKNKLPLNADNIKSLNGGSGTWTNNKKTINGVEWEIVTDSADNVLGVRANSGTATLDSNIVLVPIADLNSILGDVDYIMTGCPSGGNISKYYISIGGSGVDYGNGVTIRKPLLGTNCVCRIAQGYTANNVLFTPMLRLSTESDPTFAPYSNICPITGHTEVKVGDEGKNRLKVTATSQIVDGVEITVYDDGSVNVNGTPTNNNLNFVVGEFSVDSNSCILNGVSGGSGTTWYLQVVNEDETTQIGVTYNGDTNIPITANTTYKVRIRILRGVTLNNVVFKPMIRLASDTDPTFVPYKGYQVTVNLGGTYYSGLLDIVSGIFVADMAEKDVSASDLIDQYLDTTNNQYLAGINANAKIPSSIYILGNVKCNELTPKSQNSLFNEIGGAICIMNSGTLRVTFSGVTTFADMQTWVTNHPLQVVYELATPLTIQLTPQQVKALVGENYLSTPLDGQEIDEVKYKEVFDFDDVIKVANYFTLPLQTFTFTNKVCDVNDSRVTSNSLVDVYFTSDSMSSVEDAGITVESQNGKIVMTAEEQPVGTIQGRIKVVN